MDYEVNRVRSISSSPQVSPQGSPEPPLEVLNPENDEIQIIDKDEKKLELVVKEELETQDPKWHCFCCDLPRKTAVLALTKIILFMAMVSYIIYQLAKYFNTNINRREYTKEVLVDTVPFTYIYFAFAANNTICNTSFGFYNGTEFRVTEYFHYYEMTPNMTISDLFDYVDNENDCKGAYVVKKEMYVQYVLLKKLRLTKLFCWFFSLLFLCFFPEWSQTTFNIPITGDSALQYSLVLTVILYYCLCN